MNPNSNKESAVVILNRKENLFLPLPQFVSTLREGVIQGFSALESVRTQSSPKLEKGFFHIATLINTSQTGENDPTPSEEDRQEHDESTEEIMEDAGGISSTMLKPVLQC